MRQFHIGDIISITTGRLVSPRQMEGVSDILEYMMGGSLISEQIVTATERCKSHLIAQFPELKASSLSDGLVKIEEASKKRSPIECKKIIDAWLSYLASIYGEMHEVKPLPKKQ